MMDTEGRIRLVARLFGLFPKADVLLRDVQLKKRRPDAWAQAMHEAVPAAWANLDNADLWGTLWQKFAQPLLQPHAARFEGDQWTAVYERLSAGVRADARATFERVAHPLIDDAALHLEDVVDGDERAFHQLLGRMDVSPLTREGIVDAIQATPQLQAALADVLKNPPSGKAAPPPGKPKPPPSAAPPGVDPGDLKDGLLGALGKIATLLGAIRTVAAAAKEANERNAKVTSPVALVRHPTAIVALRVDGDAILAKDAAGTVYRTAKDGSANGPGLWPGSGPSSAGDEPAPDLTRWPPTPGPVRGWAWVTRGGPDPDVLAVVGPCDTGGGYYAQGPAGDEWAHFDDSDEETALTCAARHPDGIVVGGEDGSVRLYDPEIATGQDLDRPVRALVCDGSTVYAALDDGRVMRVDI